MIGTRDRLAHRCEAIKQPGNVRRLKAVKPQAELDFVAELPVDTAVGASAEADELGLPRSHARSTDNERCLCAVRAFFDRQAVVEHRSILAPEMPLFGEQDKCALGLSIEGAHRRRGGVAHAHFQPRRLARRGRELGKVAGRQRQVLAIEVRAIEPRGIAARNNTIAIAVVDRAGNENIVSSTPLVAIEGHCHAGLVSIAFRQLESEYEINRIALAWDGRGLPATRPQRGVGLELAINKRSAVMQLGAVVPAD